MRIAEIYRSVQGEGLLTGRPSVFVRTSGCNLRCWYCDSAFTSWAPEGEDIAVEEVIERVLAFECEHLVLTGGEPMLLAEAIPLCEAIHAAGRHITIETAGTLWLELPCDLMSISPKLANSTPSEARAGRWRSRHEQTRHQPAVIAALLARYTYQLKFVVDRPADVEEILRYLEAFPQVEPERVLLMPQGVDGEELAARTAWLEPKCRELGFVFCPRKHIEWFGFRRGT